MEKIWHVMSKIDNDFINKYPEYDRVILQLLFNRNLKKKDEIKEFFNEDCENINDPFLFKDMSDAVDLIIKHIRDNNKICIYGDYDADGITSAAVLYDALKSLSGIISVYIPDRVNEGYGLNKKAINKIIEGGTKLIITVDGGIRNKEEVKYAKNKGIDIIITDHHIASEDKNDLPECLIINPAVKSEKYPFKYLAGVGVAFQVAKAVISKSTLSDKDKKKIEDRLLDFVAIGTIADCVKLSGENRILVKKGLKILNFNNSMRIGLQELINVANINNKKIDSWNIGFQIGPRLNAAGRMDHASVAFKLLISEDRDESIKLACKLNEKNIARQKITEETAEEVEKQVDLKNDKIIIGVCSSGKSWKEGVVGLVAGRICEKYYRPVFVITKAGDEYKGSGRSIKELDLINVVEQCSEFLNKYGGHPMACGFSFPKKNLEKFIKKIKEIVYKKLENVELLPKIDIECELELNEINGDLVNNLEKFSPFGISNSRPKFVSYGAQIKDIINMGNEGQHIKFRFNGFWAVSFNNSEKWQNLKISDKVDIVYYIEKNEFNGNSEVQMKIVDIKLHNA